MRCHIAAGILLTCSRLYNSKCVEIVKTNEKNARKVGGGGGGGASRWREKVPPLP